MTEAPSSTGPRFAWLAKFDRKWQARSLLLIIVLVAVTVRVVGSRFGFPLLVHPDEWAVVEAVADMAKRHSFEPPWSLRPDHVEMKVDYILFAGYADVYRHTSVATAFAHNPIPFYWLARLATAAFGVATVGLAYLIGARTSRRLGLVMAALFALFPAYVLNAHYATPDVPLTFAVMLLIYALMRYVRTTSWSSLLWASFAVALGIAIKYPAAVGAGMIAVIIVAAALRDKAWRRLVVHGAGALGATFGFLFVISPTLFTNFSDVRAELILQSAGGRLGHGDQGLIGNLKVYQETFFYSAGIVLVLMGLLGLVLVVRRRQLDRLPWFVGVLFWIALSRLPLTWDRWGLPMWVTPLLLAAVGVVYLFDRFRSARTIWIPLAVTAVIGANMIAGVLMIDSNLVAGDTRSEALAYGRANGITAANSIYEGYTPFLPGTSQLFFKQVKSVNGGYAFYTKQGGPAEYAVLSSGMYKRILGDKAQTQNAAIYQWIFTHGQLVAQFDPIGSPQRSWLEPVAIVANLKATKSAMEGGLSGPTIKIYRLPQTSP